MITFSILKLLKLNEIMYVSFSDSSVDKESTCNVGDPGLIPGLGSTPGEGLGYPLQYLPGESP